MPYPKSPEKPPSPSTPKAKESPVGTCKVCGIDLYREMLYSCNRESCPVFPKTGQL